MCHEVLDKISDFYFTSIYRYSNYFLKNDSKFNQKSANRALVFYVAQNYVDYKTARQNLMGYEKLHVPMMLHVNVNFPRQFCLWLSRGFY